MREVQHGRREVVPVGEQQRSWLTDDELNAVEARANAATPGPWRACTWDPMERPHVTVVAPDEAICHGRLDLPRTPEDARFIAAARADVPRLVAELRALRERLAEVDRDRRQLAAAIWLAWGVKTSPISPVTCVHCHRAAERVERVEHAPDCPVLLARQVVGEASGG